MKQKPSSSAVQITGASLYGKYVTLIVDEKAVEVYVTSTVLMVIGLWVGATFCALLSLFVDMLLLTLIMSVAGGIGGFYLVRRIFRGKQDARFTYDDLTSFVGNPPDFNFNLQDGKMYTLRMMPKKQAIFIGAVNDALKVQNRYHLEKSGSYYKLVSNDSKPDET